MLRLSSPIGRGAAGMVLLALLAATACSSGSTVPGPLAPVKSAMDGLGKVPHHVVVTNYFNDSARQIWDIKRANGLTSASTQSSPYVAIFTDEKGASWVRETLGRLGPWQKVPDGKATGVPATVFEDYGSLSNAKAEGNGAYQGVTYQIFSADLASKQNSTAENPYAPVGTVRMRWWLGPQDGRLYWMNATGKDTWNDSVQQVWHYDYSPIEVSRPPDLP